MHGNPPTPHTHTKPYFSYHTPTHTRTQTHTSSAYKHALPNYPTQVLLRAREAVARYYDGVLRPDDETADAGPGGCRAAVLRPAAAGPGGAGEEAGGGAGPERCGHPDPSRAGVLLRRAMNERDLYLQVGGDGWLGGWVVGGWWVGGGWVGGWEWAVVVCV